MDRYPFSVDELEIQFRYGTMKPGPVGKPGFRTPISVAENMKRFLDGRVPVWMPYSEMVMFGPAIIPDNIARGKVFESEPVEPTGGVDMFGVDWVYDPVVRGSMVRPNSPVLEDVNDWKERIPFPDVDSWDWEGTAKRNAELLNVDVPICITQFSGFFERLISFMDFEGAALALVDEDQHDALKELFTALTDVYIKIIDKCVEHFNMSWYMFHDDWGSQRAPFFSREHWVEFIGPYIKRLVDHCHSRGVMFELHSCGHTEMLLDVISSVGIDMWRPQNMNDLKKMYDEYGDKIRLGMNVMLPLDATEEDQLKIVDELIRDFGTPGKYFFVEVFPLNHPGAEVFFKTLYEKSRHLYLQQG